jgi:hypothetical protein
MFSYSKQRSDKTLNNRATIVTENLLQERMVVDYPTQCNNYKESIIQDKKIHPSLMVS